MSGSVSGTQPVPDKSSAIKMGLSYLLSRRGILGQDIRTMARRDEASLKNRHRLEEFTVPALAMTSITI
jgi:hypothetical protein